jgi:hypothetical protein
MSPANTFITGYGDLIEAGVYSLHSRFRRVINFTSAGRLVSLVTGEMGNGPVNIAVRNLNGFHLERITVHERRLDLGKRRFSLSDGKKYCSRLILRETDDMIFRRNFTVFADTALTHSHEKSIVFLLDKRKKPCFSGSFDAALVNRLYSAWDALMKRNFLDAARYMRGTGYGFTPAGDDFIAGFLTGLHLLEGVFKNDLAGIRRLILRGCMPEKSDGEFQLSSYFISLASRGRFTERIKALLLSLCRGDGRSVVEHTRSLLSLGETSGADLAAGLIAAVEYV